jgi:taurine dioxygenase
MSKGIAADLAAIEIQRATGTIGAEIRHVDLKNLNEESFSVLRAALLEHCVLAVRDQSLTPDDHIALTKRFGDLYTYPGDVRATEDYPEVVAVASKPKTETVTEVWHVDAANESRPPAIAILVAREVPETGGDTMFANQYLAYETLSERLRQILDTLNGVNHYPSATRQQVAIHPIVRVHPETGRKSLFVSPNQVRSFEGMTEEESRGLLGFLFEHSVLPEFTYRHRWAPGDVVIWDNRCTLHYAVHDYSEAPRLLHRTSVAGDVP